MQWSTPKIVEVPVGMEINMYACASGIRISKDAEAR
jgi:coenzyme PQQ precursor peptide PqqA